MESVLAVTDATWAHVRAAVSFFQYPVDQFKATRANLEALEFGTNISFVAPRAIAVPASSDLGVECECKIQAPYDGASMLYDHTLKSLRIIHSDGSLLVRRSPKGWGIGLAFDMADSKSPFTMAMLAIGNVSSANADDVRTLLRLRARRNFLLDQFYDRMERAHWPFDPNDWEYVPRSIDADQEAELRKAVSGIYWETDVVSWPEYEPGKVKVLVARPVGGWLDEQEWARLTDLAWQEYPYGFPEANWVLRDIPLAEVGFKE